MTDVDTRKWLESSLQRHHRLTQAVSGLLENVLTTNSIEYLSISGRTKTVTSAEEKIRRKKYNEPHAQLTDLSGIRVVTFLEAQVKTISDVIRNAFEVDEENSLDRSSILGDDRIGYRSTHFVCTLGATRKDLLEYQLLSELKFEIQVRTVLQHAWAELAHDRSFKLGPGLPSPIQRKLNLYSGMLEIVDGGFDEIARDVDEYRASISRKTPDQLSEVELNALSLKQYLSDLADKHNLIIPHVEIPNDILEEFRAFGLNKIGDLGKIEDQEALDHMREHPDEDQNVIGFVRNLMMYHDIDRYFTIWKPWNGLDEPTAILLEQKYSREKLRQLFTKHGISLLDNDPEDHFSA